MEAKAEIVHFLRVNHNVTPHVTRLRPLYKFKQEAIFTTHFHTRHRH